MDPQPRSSSRLRRSIAIAACAALLACARTSTSPGTDPVDAGNSGAGTALGGGPNGGSGSPAVLSGGTAGSVTNNGGGELTVGGAAEPEAVPGPVDLCLADDQIPDDWGSAGAPEIGAHACAVGVLGRFSFDGCRYELLDTTPGDVDPFSGGHSHCCYLSKLIGCP